MATEQGATSPLTERQTEVLQLASYGFIAPEVGRELWITTDTVKTHLKHTYDALGVRTQAAAVARAWRAGWIR